MFFRSAGSNSQFSIREFLITQLSKYTKGVAVLDRRNLEATPAVEKDVLARPSPRANLKHHSSLTDSVRERLLLKIGFGHRVGR